MSSPSHDSAGSTFNLGFYEYDLVRFVAIHNRPEQLARSHEADLDLIADKWLYVFSSKGAEFAVRADPKGGTRHNGAWKQRFEHRYSRQHMAEVGINSRNPPRTSSPMEHAEQLDLEVYFDDKHVAYQNPVSAQQLSEPRHKRPHPKVAFENAFKGRDREANKSRWVRVPNRLFGRRFYFLLSSIRLGPAALREAMRPGAADGLSIWAPPIWNGHNWSPRFDESKQEWVDLPKTLRSPTGEDRKNLSSGVRIGRITQMDVSKKVWMVGVADPYKIAGSINATFYERVLGGYARAMGEVGKKSSKKPYLNTKANRGDVYQLYFIARSLKAVRASMKKEGENVPKWDSKSAQEVINFVENKLQRLKNTCESRANFLVNWLSSPAHRLIDIGISQDTADADDPDGAADRAYGLSHWYNVLSLLGYTGSGTQFLARFEKLCSDGPVTQVLMGYEKGGRQLTEIDRACFIKAQGVIPDLVLFASLLTVGSGAAKQMWNTTDRQRRAKRVMSVMNNIAFFSERLTTSPPKPTKAPTTLSDKITAMNPYIDNGTWLWEQLATKGPGAHARIKKWIFGTPDTTPDNIHQKSVENFAKTRAPSFGRFLASGAKTVPYIKLFTGIFSYLQVGAGQAETLRSSDASAWKKLKTGAALGMSATGAYEAIMAIQGVDPRAIRDVLSKKVTGLEGRSLAARVSHGSMLSVFGITSAVWLIVTNISPMLESWDKRDHNAAVGSGLAVFGGMVLLANGLLAGATAGLAGFAASGPVGWIAGGLVVLGGIIVWVATDDDFTTFTINSYFAHDRKARNLRKFGGKNEWSGPEPRASDAWMVGKTKRNWPVAHQSFALMNILSRFLIKGRLHAVDLPLGGLHGKRLVERVELSIHLPSLPDNAQFDIDLFAVAKHPTETRHRRSRTPDVIPTGISDTIRNAAHGSSAAERNAIDSIWKVAELTCAPDENPAGTVQIKGWLRGNDVPTSQRERPNNKPLRSQSGPWPVSGSRREVKGARVIEIQLDQMRVQCNEMFVRVYLKRPGFRLAGLLDLGKKKNKEAIAEEFEISKMPSHPK